MRSPDLTSSRRASATASRFRRRVRRRSPGRACWFWRSIPSDPPTRRSLWRWRPSAAGLEKAGAKVSRASALLPDLDAATPTARVCARAGPKFPFFREFDALICPILPTAAFPHDHEPDQERRKLIVNGAEQPYVDMLLLWPGVTTLPGLPATAVPPGARPKDCRSASRSSDLGSKTGRHWSSRG